MLIRWMQYKQAKKTERAHAFRLINAREGTAESLCRKMVGAMSWGASLIPALDACDDSRPRCRECSKILKETANG